MSFLQNIYPGDAFMPAGITALLQVTLVAALALLLLRAVGHRNAARQHAIGVSAMLVVLLSPLLASFVNHADLGLVSIRLARPQSAIASVQGLGSPVVMNSVSAVEISTRDMRASISVLSADFGCSALFSRFCD